jgi:hypothetical protein
VKERETRKYFKKEEKNLSNTADLDIGTVQILVDFLIPILRLSCGVNGKLFVFPSSFFFFFPLGAYRGNKLIE